MIKLSKQVEALEAIIEKLETKIDSMEEKKQSIIEAASLNGRELTDAEYRKLDKLDEQIDELNAEADAVQNAVEQLRDYTE